MVAGTMSLAPNAKNKVSVCVSKSLSLASSLSLLKVKGPEEAAAPSPNTAKRRDCSPCSSTAPLQQHQNRCAEQDDPQQPQHECSMCGDVGFSSELFRCRKCLHRFQHTYCSRFYPRIPDQDVCDWCLQDANLSAGSSNTAISTKNHQHQSRKPGAFNHGAVPVSPSGSKRKLDSPSISSPQELSPRKNNHHNQMSEHRKNSSTGTGSLIGNSSSDNEKSRNLDHGHHKDIDALELLLEVAQKVAEGQTNMSASAGLVPSGGNRSRPIEQAPAQPNPSKNSKIGTQNVAVSSAKRQRLPSNGSSLVVRMNPIEGGAGKGSSGVLHRQNHHHQHYNLQQHKQQQQSHRLLSTSRSIGRRYKLLSDVLC